jgi:hypothetical protein
VIVVDGEIVLSTRNGDTEFLQLFPTRSDEEQRSGVCTTSLFLFLSVSLWSRYLSC